MWFMRSKDKEELSMVLVVKKLQKLEIFLDFEIIPTALFRANIFNKNHTH